MIDITFVKFGSVQPEAAVPPLRWRMVCSPRPQRPAPPPPHPSPSRTANRLIVPCWGVCSCCAHHASSCVHGVVGCLGERRSAR